MRVCGDRRRDLDLVDADREGRLSKAAESIGSPAGETS